MADEEKRRKENAYANEEETKTQRVTLEVVHSKIHEDEKEIKILKIKCRKPNFVNACI